MKLDKETLLKHKFWVVLAVAGPLALITIFVLMIFVSSANARVRSKFENDTKGFGSVPETPNDENIKKWQELRDEAAGKRSKVWKDAWDAQKNIYQWPKSFEDVCKFNNGYFATEVKFDSNEADGERFAGTLHKFDDLTQEYIEVKGKEGTRQFRRTPNVVMVDNAKKNTDFQKLVAAQQQVSVKYHQYRNFYDRLTEYEYLQYIKSYKEKDENKSPLWEIIKQVNPMVEKKVETKDGPETTVTGVVLLGNAPLKFNDETGQNSLPSPASKCLRYVPQWTNKDDISEDVWLAQEDLWIQKEFYYRIKLANESISNFELVSVDGKPPAKKKGKEKEKNQALTHEQIAELNSANPGATFIFKNPYWQLELTLVKGGKVNYKLENLLPRRQKLNVAFMLRLNESDPRMEKLVVGGTTLDPKPPEGVKKEEDVKQDEKKEEDSYFKTGTFDLNKDSKPKLPARTGIYAVEQVLTLETAAVKRIDTISIGDMSPEECSQSHRTFPDKLRSFNLEKKEEVEKKDDPLDPNPPLGRPLDNRPAIRKTENGLLKDRYIEVTKEARRIPVAIVLIVDQEQIDRVLTTFRNSPLRFLTTQVILNRYPHALQVAAGQVQGAQPQQQFGIGIRMPRGPEPPRKLDPGPGPEVTGGGTEANVEVVIYGQVTLYNRFRETPAAQEPKQ